MFSWITLGGHIAVARKQDVPELVPVPKPVPAAAVEFGAKQSQADDNRGEHDEQPYLPMEHLQKVVPVNVVRLD